MKLVNPDTLVRPRGYSHGMLVGGGQLLFLAGQDASDVQGQIVGGDDLRAQFEQTLRNMREVVRAAGGELCDVVQMTIFVKDRERYLAERVAIGQIYRQYFGRHYPAMALFEVSGFFNADALIEIQGIAVIGDADRAGGRGS